MVKKGSLDTGLFWVDEDKVSCSFIIKVRRFVGTVREESD